ncbi:hypothetical protein [Acetobacterium sp.]|uniref:hypothetical protein n=1 Tax=Acetobacterium sp. TaxID=1872094 RepID=UPI0027248858|nr:hypothetical protein [Acetobacterium sp.]MDO9491002.1 hypothetical protein [Acetobacterium sp.]
MVQSRFATYYENHPETNDISIILETSNTTNKSPLHSSDLSKKEIALAKKQRADEWDYLKNSIEMKLELALMYINRSNTHLQYL